jgi:hypothetical protein
MASPKPFDPVKLVCGIISAADEHFSEAEARLEALHGPIDLRSPAFDFSLTDYYEPQMGVGLKRKFLSFANLIDPARLAAIKIETNTLEEKIRSDLGLDFRAVNIDPGIVTPAALIMATAKDFAHRVPLRHGIYAHLEFLFSRTGLHFLSWTYPDFRQEGYVRYFLEVRNAYFAERKKAGR